MVRFLNLRELKDELEDLENRSGAVHDAKTDLENAQADFEADPSEDNEKAVSDAEDALEEAQENFLTEDSARFDALCDLRNELGRAWDDEETLIDEADFEEYAQDLAEDIGAVDRNAKWPYTCIDWEQAAEELRQDYSSVEFEGVEYLYRS